MFAQIGERGEQQEHRRWVLDTGATNHMTGAKSAFFELDLGIRRTVKFGLYILELEIEQPVSLSARTEEVSWRWHARYGRRHKFGARQIEQPVSLGQLEDPR